MPLLRRTLEIGCPVGSDRDQKLTSGAMSRRAASND